MLHVGLPLIDYPVFDLMSVILAMRVIGDTSGAAAVEHVSWNIHILEV